jgi:hypothetical protein
MTFLVSSKQVLVEGCVCKIIWITSLDNAYARQTQFAHLPHDLMSMPSNPPTNQLLWLVWAFCKNYGLLSHTIQVVPLVHFTLISFSCILYIQYDYHFYIVLVILQSHAIRHKRHIVPIISIHMDFYIRVFVRIFTLSPASIFFWHILFSYGEYVLFSPWK